MALAANRWPEEVSAWMIWARTSILPPASKSRLSVYPRIKLEKNWVQGENSFKQRPWDTRIKGSTLQDCGPGQLGPHSRGNQMFLPTAQGALPHILPLLVWVLVFCVLFALWAYLCHSTNYDCWLVCLPRTPTLQTMSSWRSESFHLCIFRNLHHS